MIPLVLATGFLGSGKTTYLKGLAAQNPDRRLVFLVNEFSSTDVDGADVQQVARDVVAVVGGSIFCRCLEADFLKHLKEIPERFGSQGSPVEGLVVEASGMADPTVVSHMLNETGLDATYRLASVLTVVDPASFPKLLHTLPNITRQVEAADLVLVNKTDLFREEELAQTETLIRSINPHARLERTTFAKSTTDVFAMQSQCHVDGQLAKVPDPDYETFSLTAVRNLDVDALKRALAEQQEALFRIKGTITDAHGRRLTVDYSKAELRIMPAVSDFTPLGLVVICAGRKGDSLRRQLETVIAPGKPRPSESPQPSP